MSVSTTTSKVQYTTNGSLTEFDFTFGVASSDELCVIYTDPWGNETTLVNETDYTVAATGATLETGGRITTSTTYPSGGRITIMISTPLTQPINFTEGMPTLYENFEAGLDKLTRIAQQQQELFTRCIRASSGDEAASLQLPPAAERANKFMSFGEDGNIEMTHWSTGIPTNLVSYNAGASEPSSPYAYMLWMDTTTGLLKVRNAANTEWVIIGPYDTQYLGMVTTSNAQTITAQHTFSPSVAQPPFVLGTNAQNQTVTGLKANDTVKVANTTPGTAGLNVLACSSNSDIISLLGISGAGFPGQYLNLRIDVSSVTSATITADYIVTANASGTLKVLSSFSETVAITSSGVNGLDTGSEANSTWYYFWAIAKEDGTQDGLISASATSPTLPSGYTYKALLGSVYNDSSGNFRAQYQNNGMVHYPPILVVNGVEKSSYYSQSLALVVPPVAKAIFLYAHPGVSISLNGSTLYRCLTIYSYDACEVIPLVASQQIYWHSNTGEETYSAYIGAAGYYL